MRLLLLSIIFIATFPQKALSIKIAKKEKVFKPHMLDHPIDGCPTNSICNKKVALLRKQWLKLIHHSGKSRKKKIEKLDKFRKKFGIPFPIWVKPNGVKDDSVISWRSACSHHTQKGKEKIFMGEKFIKNIKNLYINNQNFLAQKAFLLTDQKKIKEFFIPRDDTPLLIESDRLIFQFEYEGQYYGLTIQENGQIKITENQTPKDNWPENMACPDLLKQKFHEERLAKVLHLGHFCQAIWDKSKNKYQTMIFGHSCN
ncbi:MAG: hypothetical protein VYD54_07125 [Bdellovibrionota bacterium]|nr:hypothetical protein [Bdellovibrionota bacterium]